MNKQALKRVALSALKAFAATAVVTLAAADLSNIHRFSDVQALVISVLVAGGDAALKAVQIGLES